MDVSFFLRFRTKSTVESELVNGYPNNIAKDFLGGSSLTLSDQNENECIDSAHSSTTCFKGDPVDLSRQSTLMLNDGETHEVWKPGRKFSSRSDSFTARRVSMYRSIKGVQEQKEADIDSTASMQSFVLPNETLLERRRKQWRQLEMDSLLCVEDNAAVQSQHMPSVKNQRKLTHSLTDSNIIMPVISEELGAVRANTLPNSSRSKLALNEHCSVAHHDADILKTKLNSCAFKRTFSSPPTTGLPTMCSIKEENCAQKEKMESAEMDDQNTENGAVAE